MKADQLRELNDQELTAMVDDIDAELFRLRSERVAKGKVGDVTRTRQQRRLKARVFTVLSERARIGGSA